MLQITPNLHFNGQCKQAIQLYKEAFDAKIKVMLSEADDHPQNGVTKNNEEDMVYHCEMFIGTQRFMLNDTSDESTNLLGHTMSLVVTFDCSSDVKQAFSILSDGCTIVHPMQSTSYSSCFVSLIDKFGMRWELMTEQIEK